MSDLEPITRNEKLWSGENLEPKTRREMYIRHLYDETQVIPDSPKTREEMFILKAGEELHDVTIEQLTATENGTYSEEGVAYSPVIVNVPAPVLDELTVTENGTYTPGSGTDGYNEVNVNVQPTLAMKNITANGTYNASDDNADGYSSVSVNVPLPSNAYLLKSIEHESMATFADGTDNFLKSLEVDIEPQQDLHGYDAPWVGGAGKNKLQVTATTQTINGVTFTVNDDGTVLVNGTASNIAVFNINNISNLGLTDGTQYILSGCSGGKDSTYKLDILKDSGAPEVINFNGDTTFTKSTILNREIRIVVYSGVTVNNIVFKPMIRLASVTDATFEPYSNICPISGFTEANVVVSPTTDAEDGTTYNIQFKDGDNPLTVYGGSLDVVNGELKVVPYYASYNGETLEGEWISDRDVYAVGTTPTIGAQVVNIGATPQTYQLTPTIIKSLQGDNNFFASTGEIELLQYWGEVS